MVKRAVAERLSLAPGRPQLLPWVSAQLAAPSARSARPYLLLHHVLKELASKRLGADQRAFEQVAGQLFEQVFAHWCADTSALAAALAEGPPGAPEELEERWALECKALRRLALFSAPSDARTLQEAPLAARCAPALAAALAALRPHAQRCATAQRACLRLAKGMQQLHGEHPWGFRASGALQAAIRAAVADILPPPAPDAPPPPPRPLLVRQLRLLTALLTCPAYRPPPPPGTLQRQDTAARSDGEAALKTRVGAELAAALPVATMHALLDALLSTHLLLTPQDLASWSADAEAFHQEGLADALEGGGPDEAGPASQALLVALLSVHRDALAPRLVARLQRAAEGGGQEGGMLRAEAALTALGVGAYELHDHVDFGAWWGAVLAPALAGRQPGMRPLRRRAAWLTGQWVAKLPDQLRPHVYEHLTRLLAQRDEPDLAVRLAAAAALRLLVDDWNFDERPFLPYAPAALQGLFTLALTVAEADTAAQAFSCASVIVERLGESVAPLAPALLAAVPPLWSAGEGHALLRMQLLCALTRLVSSMGPGSPGAWHVVLPLLAVAADPAAPQADLLLEEALGLWHAVLRHAPSCDGQLLALLPHALAALRRSWEHTPLLCRILTSYLLLDAGATLSAAGEGISERLAAAVGQVNERAMLLLLPVGDAVLRAFPQQAPQLLDALLVRLVGVCCGGGGGGGSGAEPPESDRVVAAASALLGRVLLQNSQAFMALMQRASGAGLGRGDALLAFLDGWVERAHAQAQPSKRRLLALALATLLGSGHLHGLARVDDAAAAVAAVLIEQREARAAGDGALLDGYDPAAAAEEEGEGWDDAGMDVTDEGAEALRRAALVKADPLQAADPAHHFAAALEAARAQHGVAAVAQGLARLDARTSAALTQAGIRIA